MNNREEARRQGIALGNYRTQLLQQALQRNMILNVNTYANVILERSLRANEGHIGVNESIMTIMKHIWTQMNVYFP